MNQTSRNISRFFLTAIVLLVLLQLGLWAKTQFSSPAYSKEVKDYAQSIETVSLRNLKKQFAGERPTVLFVFASWCPHCQRQMKELDSFNKRYRGQVAVGAISVDKDKHKLASYLIDNPNDLTVFHVSAPIYGDFTDLIEKMGGEFSGSIPYTAVISKQKIVAHAAGFVDNATLKQMVQRAY